MFARGPCPHLEEADSIEAWPQRDLARLDDAARCDAPKAARRRVGITLHGVLFDGRNGHGLKTDLPG